MFIIITLVDFFMAEQLFTVQGSLPLNLEFLASDFVLPEFADFVAQKPQIFKLCGALLALDFKSTKAIKEDGPEYAELVAAVERQNEKINQILSFLISVYDEKFESFETYEFSGNGFSFVAPLTKKVKIGSLLRTRIYLLDSSTAVFCYVRIIGLAPAPQGLQGQLINTEFVLIEAEDREQMVGATFRAQRHQLRLRAKKNQSL